MTTEQIIHDLAIARISKNNGSISDMVEEYEETKEEISSYYKKRSPQKAKVGKRADLKL